MTAGMAATRPKAVAMSASPMAGATTGKDALFSSPMRSKASMMPHTVPNRPMNGEADAMLERVGMSAAARCSSAVMARRATAPKSSLEGADSSIRAAIARMTWAPGAARSDSAISASSRGPRAAAAARSSFLCRPSKRPSCSHLASQIIQTKSEATTNRPSTIWPGSDAPRITETRSMPPASARSTRASAFVRKHHVDATVLGPGRFVGARGVELAARAGFELLLRETGGGNCSADIVGATTAEDHVVLLFAARIGVADEQHRLALERTGGEAGRELLEQLLVAVADGGRVEGEVSLRVGEPTGLPDGVGDVDVALGRIVTGLLGRRGSSGRCRFLGRGRGLGLRWGVGRAAKGQSGPNEERDGAGAWVHRSIPCWEGAGFRRKTVEEERE